MLSLYVIDIYIYIYMNDDAYMVCVRAQAQDTVMRDIEFHKWGVTNTLQTSIKGNQTELLI